MTDAPNTPPLSLAVYFGGEILCRAGIVSPEGATPETWEFCVHDALERLPVARGRMIGNFLGELRRRLPRDEDDKAFDLADHLRRQRDFNSRVFWPHQRLGGLIAHVRKELIEVEASGGSLAEWVDVVILGFDGCLRSGASPADVVKALTDKRAVIEARTWPTPASPDEPIEHDRSHDVQPHACECGDCDQK